MVEKGMSEEAVRILKYLLEEDSEVEFRIRTGTECNRKGFGRVELLDAAGKPLPVGRVRLRQTGSEFKFGCNAFMVDQFPEAEQNEAYEQTFAAVFNHAVIPFYWSDLEPEEGKPRFERHSPPIYRRPPPDRVLEFCDRFGLIPKGHPLCWHQFLPKWIPTTVAGFRSALDRRMRAIAARYADRIHIWDTVNEAQTRFPLLRPDIPELGDGYVDYAFRRAAELFPDSQLIYNDDRAWWSFQGDNTASFLLAQRLLEHGFRLGGFGVQYHMFDTMLQEAEVPLRPRNLLAVLDLFGKLGVPVNLSEVSVISRRSLGDGDRFQELATEKLYRLWFSHAAVEGITWWNLVDGTAAYAPPGSEEGENRLRAGLVNYDFTPKPAYKVLRRLIREEWRTETEINFVPGGDNRFHGFYGDYDVEISTDGGLVRRKLQLSKGARNVFLFQLEK